MQATDRSKDTSIVLEDDDFEAKMAAIIERDYFPDVKPLQNKLEWTLASDSGDPEMITNAQRNIMLRRAGYSVCLLFILAVKPFPAYLHFGTMQKHFTPIL
jgi:hypothetical protein